MKNKIILSLLTVFFLLFSGCALDTEESPLIQAVDDFSYDEAYQITDADLQTENIEAEYIDLTKQRAITWIKDAGTYVLSGNYEGQICIDAQDERVHLILNGVNIQSYDGPALYVKSASKVILTLAEQTENVCMDSTDYSDYKDSEACIFSTSDLTINGSGTMYVYGYYKDALRSRDVIKVLDGNLFIQSKSDGIHGNDGIVLMPETLSIESEGKCLYTTKNGKREKGFIDICGGKTSLISGEYAISSAADVSIRTCTVSCKSVIADIFCEENQYIEEGCLQHE
ncbi:MAG: carbohydrate-binding domain-containing protein [Lachnospiraceae bacterium]|nr:carbohydrate-binding domain-containing protein [Lachnospiraceae bacterium]